MLAAAPANAAPPPVQYTAQGDIIITGDNGPQYVEIEDHEVGYEILYRSGGIDGYYYVAASGRDIIVKLKNGNDKLFLDIENRLSAPRDVKIELGGGNNRLDGSAGFTVGRNFKLTDGSGSSSVDMELSTSQFRDSVNFRTGNKADKLRIDRQTEFAGRTTLFKLGGGHDSTRIFGATSNDRFSFRGDGGDDLLVVTASTFRSSVTLNGNGGTDRLGGEATPSCNRQRC